MYQTALLEKLKTRREDPMTIEREVEDSTNLLLEKLKTQQFCYWGEVARPDDLVIGEVKTRLSCIGEVATLYWRI